MSATGTSANTANQTANQTIYILQYPMNELN